MWEGGDSVDIKVTVKDVDHLAKKLQKKSQEDFVACCTRATGTLFSNAQKRTPVAPSAVYKDKQGNVLGQHKGGGLRRSLRATMPTASGQGVVGYTIHYAPHVEYGHRQKVGQFVPVLGKRLKASFVPGQYFLKSAVEDTRPEFYADLKKTMED